MIMYSVIIDSLYKDKLVIDAFHLYSEMDVKNILHNVVTHTTLIYGFCIAGKLKQAVSFFTEMVLKNINPDVYAFNELINGLCKERYMKGPKHVLAVMIRQSVEPDVVTYNLWLKT